MAYFETRNCKESNKLQYFVFLNKIVALIGAMYCKEQEQSTE